MQFKVEYEQQIFEKLFMAILLTLRIVARILLRAYNPDNLQSVSIKKILHLAIKIHSGALQVPQMCFNNSFSSPHYPKFCFEAIRNPTVSLQKTGMLCISLKFVNFTLSVNLNLLMIFF